MGGGVINFVFFFRDISDGCTWIPTDKTRAIPTFTGKTKDRHNTR